MTKSELQILTSDFVSHTRRYRAIFELDSYLIRLQYEGNCSIVIGENTYSIEPGNLLLFAPNESYELIIHDDMKTNGKSMPISDYYLYALGDWLDKWWKKQKRENPLTIPLDESVIGIWKQINLEKRKSEVNDEVIDYLLRILCLNIDRLLVDRGSSIPQSRSFLVFRMKNFIEKHATENFNLQNVADDAEISVSRAVSLFKSVFGKTIMQYALEVRLSIAIERIRYSKMTLEQVAESSGFGSYSYFFRAFRSKYGLTPNQYRDTILR